MSSPVLLRPDRCVLLTEKQLLLRRRDHPHLLTQPLHVTSRYIILKSLAPCASTAPQAVILDEGTSLFFKSATAPESANGRYVNSLIILPMPFSVVSGVTLVRYLALAASGALSGYRYIHKHGILARLMKRGPISSYIDVNDHRGVLVALLKCILENVVYKMLS